MGLLDNFEDYKRWEKSYRALKTEKIIDKFPNENLNVPTEHTSKQGKLNRDST